MQPPGDRVGVPRDDGVAVDDGTAVLLTVIVIFFTLALPLLLLGVSALLRILRLKRLGNAKEMRAKSKN